MLVTDKSAMAHEVLLPSNLVSYRTFMFPSRVTSSVFNVAIEIVASFWLLKQNFPGIVEHRGNPSMALIAFLMTSVFKMQGSRTLL